MSPRGTVTALISRDDVIAVGGGVGVVVALQPVVRLRDRTLAGVEALARFPSPPAAPPDRWFASAEAAGVARDLELAVVRRALCVWAAEPVGGFLAVNVSAQTLVDPALLLAVLDADVSPGSLVVEVTEHHCVDDDDAALAAIERLRAAGARVALDDVGAGFASLDLVRRLRPDLVKIDGDAVAALRAPAPGRLVAAAAAAAARCVGAELAVEGVETADDVRQVSALGAAYAQGYHFGRPSADRSMWRRWASGRVALASS